MISALSWVPKGASKSTPVIAEPPSKEEIEAIMKSETFERSQDNENEEDQDMDADATMEVDEVTHALAAADALSKGQGIDDIADGLKELDMDNYDNEDDDINIFRADVYYPSNDMDPYLKNEADEDDEEEVDDMTILPTDGVVVCARHEDEVNHLEVWIYQELEDGDTNMYVHHDVILADFPLCTAWLDCKPQSVDKGNFIAVGSMDPAIEIWDLDLIDELQPVMVLGGVSKKAKKGKKKSVKYKKGSHRDSVLGLAWNKEVRNVLASASADKSLKIWDIASGGKCILTVEHHKDKVQAVEWSRRSPEVLLSGSFDHSVAMMDMRSNSHVTGEWLVSADVECLAWDPHSEYSFVVSLENGMVQGFDSRAAETAGSGSKSVFTLHAHSKAVSSISFNPVAPNLLATGSTDKMVKLWDLTKNQPSCVVSQSPNAGAIFSTSFSEDSPFLLAIGGSKGKLKVWDTLTDPGVAGIFGKFGSKKTAPTSEDLSS